MRANPVPLAQQTDELREALEALLRMPQERYTEVMHLAHTLQKETRADLLWLAVVLGHATRATLSVLRFRPGKWRSIEVKLGTA